MSVLKKPDLTDPKLRAKLANSDLARISESSIKALCVDVWVCGRSMSGEWWVYSRGWWLTSNA